MPRDWVGERRRSPPKTKGGPQRPFFSPSYNMRVLPSPSGASLHPWPPEGEQTAMSHPLWSCGDGETTFLFLLFILLKGKKRPWG